MLFFDAGARNMTSLHTLHPFVFMSICPQARAHGSAACTCMHLYGAEAEGMMYRTSADHLLAVPLRFYLLLWGTCRGKRMSYGFTPLGGVCLRHVACAPCHSSKVVKFQRVVLSDGSNVHTDGRCQAPFSVQYSINHDGAAAGTFIFLYTTTRLGDQTGATGLMTISYRT